MKTGKWLTIGICFLVICAITAPYVHRPGDFAGYLLVGDLVLAGREIYHDAPLGLNNWPPLFALFCVPWALIAHLSVVAARLAWLALNWIALWFALDACIRIVTHRNLSFRRPTADEQTVYIGSVVALLPLLLSIRWILSNLEHLQVNIIVFALVVVGLRCHRAGRNGVAATLIGLASALKVLPVVFIPYFFWRRQWKTAAYTFFSTVLWTMLPALVFGPARFVVLMNEWLDFFHRGQGVGKMNVSFFAMVDRFFGYRMIPFTVAGIENIPPSGSRLVSVLVLASLGAVTAWACWAFRGKYDPDSRKIAAEWSIVLLVGTIFSPLTWKYYLIVLLLPMVLFVATWRDAAYTQRFRSKLRWYTWLSFAFGILSADVVVGRSLAYRLEMTSFPTVMALVALVTLFWYQRQSEGELTGT